MSLHRLALIPLALAIATPASAELLARKDLSLNTALTIATTAIETCKSRGYSVSVTVVGREGQVILQLRGDGSNPHTMENSMRKAYTSRTTRAPSGNLTKRLKDDPSLSFIHLTHVIAAQGALPIKIGDDTIGGAGASGAPGGEKDEACIQAGLDKIAGELK